ncbi:kelch repeat-containing protein [Planctomycetota bacterium]
MKRENIRILILVCVILAGIVCGQEQAGVWVKIGKSGGSMGTATVYAPSSKAVINWGGLKSGNEVRRFDLNKKAWTQDYSPDKAGLGGNFYGGQPNAGWVKGSDRPAPFFLFRTACWDSKRNRMVVQALNLTAAYDPSAKKWTDLKASVVDADGKTYQGTPPPGWSRPWFMTVAGQWGSMCYDSHNDEIILFPLWVCRSSRQKPKNGKAFKTAIDLPEEAGVRIGHYGTLVYSCSTNVWNRPKCGGKEILSLRADLEKLINDQREAVRAGWKGLIALRTEKKDEADKLSKAAGEVQKKVNTVLAGFKKKLSGSKLKGYEAVQVKTAFSSLISPLKRLNKAASDLSAGKADELHAICSQQRAAYRELRLILKHDLHVQPLPRSSTGIVYDSKNTCAVMAGGYHQDRYLNDTWVYDSDTRRWNEASPAPEAANWPGMCFDSKRGLVLYAAGKGTYGYDAAKDVWSKVGPARPKGIYCDMVYDEASDIYVLNVSNNKYRKDETTYTMKPAGLGTAVQGKPEVQEKVDDRPFPPPADQTILARLKSLPANTWAAAKPNFEPTHRSWSTMSWDPALRCVIYQGGGHAGTMDNQVSAYFPENNTWVKSFKRQLTPPIFGSWSGAGFITYERGVGGSTHCRWYESFEGRMVYGSQGGFEWATRERPLHQEMAPVRGVGGVLCGDTGKLIYFTKNRYYDDTWTSRMTVHDFRTGQSRKFSFPKPFPKIQGEWSGICVHPDKDIAVIHGAGPRKPKRADNETWLLDMKKPTAWKKIESKITTPSVGMGKLNAIPGTDLVVCTLHGSNDLWVLSLDRQEWKPLGTDEGKKYQRKGRLFDIYGQCVYDPHHKIFIAMQRGSGHKTMTLLLRPDFSKIKW